MTIVVPDVFLSRTASIQTTLFRSYAYPHPRTNKWKVVVLGRRAYDIPTNLNLAKRLMLRGLLKRLEAGSEILNNPNFQQRVSGFLVAADSPRRIQLNIEGHAAMVRRRSRKSGMFGGRITLPENAFDDCQRFGMSLALGRPAEVSVDTPSPIATAHLMVAEKTGLSIVSDIDDTIKHTDVINRKVMLSRTFVDPFKPILGMADIYRAWSKEYSALFHYVSSSPWQLYSALEGFMDEFEFPVGSIHLRWFSLREELLRKWRLSRGRKKVGIIRTLIKRMPQRRFLLIGDSSERDPEIYAEVAAKHPLNVAGVIVRDIEENPMDYRRVSELSAALGNIPFKVFREPSEIVNVLDDWRISASTTRS